MPQAHEPKHERAGKQRSRGDARLVYFSIVAVLFAFWAVVAVFVGVVAVRAVDADGANDRVEVAVTATPIPEPTLRPKPAGAPVEAQRLVNFDTGAPAQHLFFHIQCEDGILAVVTTDEIVLAEWPCEGVSIDHAEVEPFLGKAVRIYVEGTEHLVIEAAGIGKLEFNVDSAWLVRR